MGIRGGLSRGSTLIYHSKQIRSRTHFPMFHSFGLTAGDPNSLRTFHGTLSVHCDIEFRYILPLSERIVKGFAWNFQKHL